MLDADSLPLRDPTYLLSSPHVLQHGVMFCTDFWSPGLSKVPLTANSTVYGLVGIKEEPYWVRDTVCLNKGSVKHAGRQRCYS